MVVCDEQRLLARLQVLQKIVAPDLDDFQSFVNDLACQYVHTTPRVPPNLRSPWFQFQVQPDIRINQKLRRNSTGATKHEGLGSDVRERKGELVCCFIPVFAFAVRRHTGFANSVKDVSKPVEFFKELCKRI